MCIRQTLSQLLSIQLQYHSCMNIQARPNFADDFVLSFFKYGRTAAVWSSRLMCLVAALEASICYLSRPATQSHFQGHIHLRRWIAQLALPWLAMQVQRPLTRMNTKWILYIFGRMLQRTRANFQSSSWDCCLPCLVMRKAYQGMQSRAIQPGLRLSNWAKKVMKAIDISLKLKMYLSWSSSTGPVELWEQNLCVWKSAQLLNSAESFESCNSEEQMYLGDLNPAQIY